VAFSFFQKGGRGMKHGQNSTQLHQDHVVRINGKDFVKYSGLLDIAESRGLVRLEVEVIQFPAEENNHTAVCLAKVELEDKICADIGEASAKTLSPEVSDYLLSMASTRSKARALKTALSIGAVSDVELRSFDDVNSEKPAGQPVQTKLNPKPPAKHNGTITPAQKSAIKGMAARNDLDPDKLAQEMFQAPLDKLTKRNASTLIEHLKSQAA
jgi:hypothetical protein